MNNCLTTTPPNCPVNNNCPDKNGCIPGVCPDFVIKRFDTLPPFKYLIEDENGDAIDLTGLVVEASMWINISLKKAITAEDTQIELANCIGFEQLLVGDVIIVDRARSPEHMLITGFDENNKLIFVERAVNGTTADSYKKNTKLKGFRFIGASGSTEMVIGDITLLDGNLLCDQILESYLVYNFSVENTCVSGCYCFEFKLLTMDSSSIVIPSVIPQCYLGVGVLAAQRYPKCGNFLIKICDSPTAEI